MASPSELSLDCMPTTYPLIQNPLGDHQPEQTRKLKDFIARLQEEKVKIEAFKRELPLCMQLLNNALETCKRQLETYQSNDQEAKPVLEEFIPINNMSINGLEKSSAMQNEKANWMVSAQLWSPNSSEHQTKQQALNTKLALETKQRNGGGAFLPFSKEKMNKKVVPELGLSSVEKEIVEERKSLEINNDGVDVKSGMPHEQHGKGGSDNNNSNSKEGHGGSGGGGHRKARRCWSPDLHRRFVNALQMLGGSQVATPKQIRELMKVDGLTNDEVKSHLQKYRLHTRRPIQPPQPPPTTAPQLVVLGGIWVSPEYATSAAAAAANTAGHAIYGAPPHYSLPHDFYASPQLPPHHHHHVHRPTVPYKARVHSPDSGLRSSGDCSESIEEGREGEEREAEEEEEEEEGGGGDEVMDDDQEAKVADSDEDHKALVPTAENNGLTLA